jgi:hypothetical protein
MNKLIQIFKDKFGELDIKNKAYALAVKDAVIYLYYDEDEETVKVDVEAVDYTEIDKAVTLEEIIL